MNRPGEALRRGLSPSAPCTTNAVVRHDDAGVHESLDTLAVEEPLDLRLEGRAVALVMRTPGDDLDLAAGFLWTEGVIEEPGDLKALATVAPNVVDAVLAEGVPMLRRHAADRALFATSSCGLCGKESAARLRRPPGGLVAWDVAPAVVRALPGALRAHQPVFAATGGVHAAALFGPDGTILLAREDVGRHNAVDKVLGARLRADELPLDGLGLLVSSRGGFEIVAKAASAGVGVLVTVGAPSSLAADAARETGMALWAWASAGRAVRVA
ncbi:MAG: hypothetical protein RLZZ299_2711 [Pseudomonadota bacterium]